MITLTHNELMENATDKQKSMKQTMLEKMDDFIQEFLKTSQNLKTNLPKNRKFKVVKLFTLVYG